MRKPQNDFLRRATLLCLLLAAAEVRPCRADEASPPTAAVPSPTSPSPTGYAALEEAAQLLFTHGVSELAGHSYREVSVRVARVWNPEGTIVKTHGWVSEKEKPARAICWNGLVYPVSELGPKADLEKDAAELLEAFRQRTDRGLRLFGFPDEASAVSHISLDSLQLKWMMLLRADKPDEARQLWEMASERGGLSRRDGTNLGEHFASLAQSWLFCQFDRSICAYMRGDDDLALEGFDELARILPEIKKTQSAHPLNRDTDPFEFLDDVPTYFAEAKRRKAEQASSPGKAPEAPDGKTNGKPERIWRLIARLEEINARQFSQPGGVVLGESPTVQALIREGDAAVEPLLECLEHDNRFTRSVHFWRDFAPPRMILGVHEAAYAALAGILETSFFEVHSTGSNLTNSGPITRAETVAAIRAYWEKRKSLSREERWWVTLADDKASMEQWVEAAENIVRPRNSRVIPATMVFTETKIESEGDSKGAMAGEALRAKSDPTLAELLQRRIAELAPVTADQQHLEARLALADVLLRWSGTEATGFVRRLCNEVAGSLRTNQADSRVTHRLLSLAGELLMLEPASGHESLLKDYVSWLKTVPPENVSLGDLFMGSKGWFALMTQRTASPLLQQTAVSLFADPAAPWPLYIRSNVHERQVQELLVGPMLDFEGFRAMIIAALRDHSRAGESGSTDGSWIAKMESNGQGSRQVMASLNEDDPEARQPPDHLAFRFCDLLAWTLFDAAKNARTLESSKAQWLKENKEGFPRCELYWPEEKRDAAIATSIRILEKWPKPLRKGE